MPPANFATSITQPLLLILYSLGLLIFIDVLASMFLAQFYLHWSSDVEWDPVKLHERKEIPELCITVPLWTYASWHAYLKLYV